MLNQNILNWSEIKRAPQKPGIYAWYFRPQLADHDIKELINKINEDPVNASDQIKIFLSDRLFKYFKQKPYEVQISGQLKPKYSGTIEHEQGISKELITRIIETPERLFDIRNLLEKSAPMFASPLYVGMSSNIYRRVNQHVSCIKKYKELAINPLRRFVEEEISYEEKSFAQRIVEREIPSTLLFLVFQITDGKLDIEVDVENIINRIYYPTFGRN